MITLEMWLEFAEAVEDHIANYTIPQYGDWPDDQMSRFTDEDIKTSIARYENRRGKGARGVVEEMRDCLKIAHYYQCLEARHGPRVELWRDFASLVAEYIYYGSQLLGVLANACEHWHKLKAQIYLGVYLGAVEQVSGEQVVPLHRSSPHALTPEYKSLGASGFDLAASESVMIWPWRRKTVSTGWRMEIPEGTEVQVRPRSGLALKGVFLMPNSPGTIDSDYRGEVKVILLNASLWPVRIKQGDRIAQGILAPVIRARFKETDDLSETVRGASGFGSTGV